MIIYCNMLQYWLGMNISSCFCLRKKAYRALWFRSDCELYYALQFGRLLITCVILIWPVEYHNYKILNSVICFLLLSLSYLHTSHIVHFLECRFRNELPDPTMQPKLLAVNQDKDRYESFSVFNVLRLSIRYKN